jgi:plasmid stabilization system protein ParE
VNAKVVWAESARESLRGIRDYYEQQRTGSGYKVAAAIVKSIDGLRIHPLSAPMHPRLGDPSIRRKVAGQHVVVYRVDDELSEVQVLSIRHGRQLGPTMGELLPR